MKKNDGVAEPDRPDKKPMRGVVGIDFIAADGVRVTIFQLVKEIDGLDRAVAVVNVHDGKRIARINAIGELQHRLDAVRRLAVMKVRKSEPVSYSKRKHAVHDIRSSSRI